jgi:hypothetical protein
MRPKARFLGEDGPRIAAARRSTGEAVTAFIQKHACGSAEDFSDLIEDVEAAAWLARQTILFAENDSSVQDARAELTLLLRWVNEGNTGALAEFWPKVSPDVWNALRCHVVTDPFERGEFNDLVSLRGAIFAALERYGAVDVSDDGAKVLVRARRPHEVRHSAALELARRVEAALLAHAGDLRVSLAAYADNAGQSAIVELLHAVGKSIKIHLAMTGWRDILSEARRGR